MYSSAAETAKKISIPSVYVTMQDGKALEDAGEVDVEVKFPPKKIVSSYIHVFKPTGGSVTALACPCPSHPNAIAHGHAHAVLAEKEKA